MNIIIILIILIFVVLGITLLIRMFSGNCKHFPLIRYEEEYSKEGEPYYHHTYRITYCDKCGKILKKEQLQ